MNLGFSRELVVPALQMANFDMHTAQNLLLDDVGGIIAFAQRQNALKEEYEAEKERKETEAALKMSMQADMAEAGKVSIPMISVEEFKTQTKDFVKEMFRVLLVGARSGGIQFMQDDNILSFAKTILGGSLKEAMPELAKEEF